MRTLIRATVILALVSAAACTAAPPSSNTPAPGRSGTDYTIRPGDVLQIRVWPDTSLSGAFPIEGTGYAYLPVVGRVEAGGRHLEDLRADLRAAYAREMTMPVVTVTPIFRVSVLGAVRGPGLYQVDPTMTLYDVISMAGGFLEDADPNRLRIIRDGRAIEVQAAEALWSGGGGADWVGLQSGDRIVVPEEPYQFVTWENVWRAVEVTLGIITLVNVVK